MATVNLNDLDLDLSSSADAPTALGTMDNAAAYPSQDSPGGPPRTGNLPAADAPAGSGAAAAADATPRSPPAWPLSIFQPYFDISTMEVAHRLKRALVPIGPPFYPSPTDGAVTVPDSENGQLPTSVPTPDLYGPVWIVTTLVFVLAITGNLVSYFENSSKGMSWSYDFEKVTVAATVFYFSLIVFPLIVYFVLRYLSASRTLVNIISLYGYSFAIYIPICPICAIPVSYLPLAATLFAWLVSTFFVARNVYSYFLTSQAPLGDEAASESHKKLGLLLVLGIAAVHFGIATVAYVYFFRW